MAIHESGFVLWSLRLVAVLGCIFFGGLLGVVHLSPGSVERSAKAFVVGKLQDEIAGLADSSQGRLVKRGYDLLRERFEGQLADTGRALVEKLPEKIAGILARLCSFDCGTESKIAAFVRDYLKDRQKALALALTKFGQLVQGRYSAILGSLMTELRIVAACNLGVFMALLISSFLARPRRRFLILPSLFLLGSTLVVGYFYIFEQNWFYAILFERYLGLGYLGYVAFLFFWLIEIVYLKARITQMVFDAVGSMLSKCGIPT